MGKAWEGTERRDLETWHFVGTQFFFVFCFFKWEGIPEQSTGKLGHMVKASLSQIYLDPNF